MWHERDEQQTSVQSSTGAAARPSGAGGDGREQVRNAKEHVKDDAERVKRRLDEMGHRLRDQAARLGDNGKKRAAEQLRSIQTALCATDGAGGEDSAGKEIVHRISRGIDEAAEYVENVDVRELVRDASGVARRHPAAVLGGLAIVGFAAGRLLSARPPDPSSTASGSHADGHDPSETATPGRASSGFAQANRPAGGLSASPSPGFGASRGGNVPPPIVPGAGASPSKPRPNEGSSSL